MITMSPSQLLCMSVNAVDLAAYPKDRAPRHVLCPRNNADRMAKVLQERGFDVAKELHGTDATCDNLRDWLRTAAKSETAKLTILYYSGHGGQVLDMSGDESEDAPQASAHAKKYDETWCLYDGHFLDDELHDLLAAFPEGHEVVVIMDCCHAGGMDRSADMLDHHSEVAVYRGDNGKVQCNLVKRRSAQKGKPIHATVVMLASCGEEELAYCTRSPLKPSMGRFTQSLTELLENGFAGDYCTLIYAAYRLAYIAYGQNPVIPVLGPADAVDALLRSKALDAR